MKCVHNGTNETVYEVTCPACAYEVANYDCDSPPVHYCFYCPRCGYISALYGEPYEDSDDDSTLRKSQYHIIECSRACHATWMTLEPDNDEWWLYGTCGVGADLRRFIEEVRSRADELVSGGYIYRDGNEWFARDVLSDVVSTFDTWRAWEGWGLDADPALWGYGQVTFRTDPVTYLAHKTKWIPRGPASHVQPSIPGIDSILGPPQSLPSIAAEIERRQLSWEVAHCPQARGPDDEAGIRAILEYQRDFYTTLAQSNAAWPGDRRRARFYTRILHYMDRGYDYEVVSTVAVWPTGFLDLRVCLLLPALPFLRPCTNNDLYWEHESYDITALTGVPESDILRLRAEMRKDAQLDPSTPALTRNVCLARCGSCSADFFGPFCGAGWHTTTPGADAAVHPEDPEDCEYFMEMTVLGQDLAAIER